MSLIALKLESFWKQTNSFIRFLLVGVINTLTGLSITFMLLNVLGWSYWLSTFIGNGSGACVSFLLNRAFTFQSNIEIKKSALRFFSLILLCYFFSFSSSDTIAELIYHHFGMSPLISNDELAILLGTGFYTVSNYLGQKYFVFRK
jgi:putative flippase GtrA